MSNTIEKLTEAQKQAMSICRQNSVFHILAKTLRQSGTLLIAGPCAIISSNLLNE